MVVYIGALLFLKIDIYLTRWRKRANIFKKRNLKHKIFAMFTQFQFCQLCRINHKKKRKHIYSIRHQNVVNNILEKYLRKVSYRDWILGNVCFYQLDIWLFFHSGSVISVTIYLQIRKIETLYLMVYFRNSTHIYAMNNFYKFIEM